MDVTAGVDGLRCQLRWGSDSGTRGFDWSRPKRFGKVTWLGSRRPVSWFGGTAITYRSPSDISWVRTELPYGCRQDAKIDCDGDINGMAGTLQRDKVDRFDAPLRHVS